MPPNKPINSRESISLEESRAAGKTVAVGSPLLAVAGLAVDVPVRAVAGYDRVEGLGAVPALEALPVPLAALGQHLLRGEDDPAAAGAALARRCLDRGSVDDRGVGRRVTIMEGQTHTPRLTMLASAAPFVIGLSLRERTGIVG